MDLVVASLLALLIGVSLGAVGGGGSILAVPVLIGVLGLSVTEATTSSLIVVGVSSLVGMVAHHLAGRVRIGAGLGFGLAGIGGAFVGTWVHDLLDEDALLVGFGLLMLAVAVRMVLNLRAGRKCLPEEAATTADPAVPTPDPAVLSRRRNADQSVLRDRTEGGVATLVAPPTTSTTVWTPRRIALVLATGSAVGFLTGLFGVGGGFVIVPALMLVLGFPLAEATGTSLLVITVNSVVALAMRGGPGAVDWGVMLPFTASAVAGVLVGRRVADRVPARTLTIALTGLIVVVGLWTAARGVSGPA